MGSFQSGGTYRQYVPERSAGVLVLRHVDTWPDASLVLTRPAVDGIMVRAERANLTVSTSGHDRTHVRVIRITGPDATLDALLVADHAMSPTSRVALHRALTATSRDVRVQRIFNRNLKAALEAI